MIDKEIEEFFKKEKEAEKTKPVAPIHRALYVGPPTESAETEEKAEDAINPEHYKQGTREAIDIMEDIVSDPAFNGVEGFLVAIAVKYLLRHKHKNGVEDLEKAIWYIKRLIAYNGRKK